MGAFRITVLRIFAIVLKIRIGNFNLRYSKVPSASFTYCTQFRISNSWNFDSTTSSISIKCCSQVQGCFYLTISAKVET